MYVCTYVSAKHKERHKNQKQQLKICKILAVGKRGKAREMVSHEKWWKHVISTHGFKKM